MKILLMLVSAMNAKPVATELVNQTERFLQQNRDQYLAGPHDAAARDLALRAYDGQMAQLFSSDGCGSAVLGAAGRACIADRSRGGRWPWETYYRDPIANAR